MVRPVFCFFFFFNDTATTEIYTLSLHDALPIFGEVLLSTTSWKSAASYNSVHLVPGTSGRSTPHLRAPGRKQNYGAIDRKSTRLNSSHGYISYAVFCLKKKKKQYTRRQQTTTQT